MKPDCVAAVQQAAERAGLTARTPAQLDAIDSRLRATMRRLARTEEGWQGLSNDQRLAAASDAAIADIRAEAARKVRNAELQVLKTAATENRIAATVARGEDRHHALVHDIEQTADYITGVKNESMSRLLALMDAVKSGEGAGMGRRVAQFLFDAENPTMTRDLANEVYRNADGSTGNKIAQEGARAYLDVIEANRQRFNAAGGDVGKLDYGYLAPPWEASKVRQAGRLEWAKQQGLAGNVLAARRAPPPEFAAAHFADTVLPHVDRDRMLREDGSRMSDTEVRDFLRASWETIATGGLNKTEPGAARGTGARANRGSESREIHLKDGDAWLEVAGEFGKGSMYEAMAGHLGRVARDIGLVERYGPNPNAQFRLQLDLARRADGEKLRVFGMRPESYWDVVSGVTGSPDGALLAQIGSNGRNLQSAAKLGSAVISSITDTGTLVITTGYNRLGYWRTFSNIARTAASKDFRDMLTSHGIIAESMRGDLNRWTGENIGQNWSGRLANSTMKLSLLNAWTDTLRRGFQATLMQAFARMSRSEWGALSEWDRALMERRGLTADDWSVLRSAELTPYGGLEHLTPEAIRATGHERANEVIAKYLGILQDEGEFAVVNPDLATKTMATGGGMQAGTVRGEIARSVMQFKSFPLAMISRHWRRMLDSPKVTDGSAPWLANRSAYFGALMLTTTALGAIAVQAKQIVTGKDPVDMFGPHAAKFWAKAVAQGGGLSIIGDLLLNDPTDGPGDMVSNTAKSLLGPWPGSVLEAILKLGVENIWQGSKGKQTHVGAEVLQWAKSNAPLVNLWYTKSLIDHLFLHALQENLSPGYLSKMQQRSQKDWGQAFWWKPGQAAPQRPPAIEKAVQQ